MSTTTTIRSFAFKALSKTVPDSVEEFDKLAKEAGAALREAIRNVLYRSTLAEFRDTYLHGAEEEKDKDGNVIRGVVIGLDKQVGMERKTRITKPAVVDAEGKITTEATEVWDETEDVFFERIVADLVTRKDYPTIEAAIVGLQPGAQAVLDGIAFDPSKRERKSAGPKKTPELYLKTADSVIAATGSVEAAASKVGAKLGITIEATREALAAAIWKDQTSQARQAQVAAQYS